jgi:uncharacterized membrane protein YhaH (DUF805 family)
MTRDVSGHDEAQDGRSRQLAGVMGPLLVAFGVTEALNFRIWATNIPAVTYLDGTILFTAGLAVVRAHNRWTRSWPVLVTLVAWFFMFLGLYRMVAPEAQQAEESAGTYAGFVGIAAIGLVLTAKAYWPHKPSA